MKKYITLALVALIAFATTAQVRTSRTFSHKKTKTEWLIRAGFNINSLSGVDYDGNDDLSTGSKAGFNVDFGFNRYFGQSNGYWGMELGVGSRGFKIENSDYDDYDASYTGYNVKFVPVMFGYKFPVTDNIKIDGHFGIFACYDFSSSSSDDYEIELDNKFDVGLQIGAGVWYKRVNLDFMYQRGFINADPCIDYNYYYDGGASNMFIMRLGVAF